MKLALGTVQFGIGYGIAGTGHAVPESQVTAILDRACHWGIDLLDTAAAYGDIESRLHRLVGDRPLHVVSKLPPQPPGLDEASAAAWAGDQVARSCERLGDRLVGLMFHRPDDLDGPLGPVVWASASTACRAAGLRLGVSAYDCATVDRLAARLPIALVQLPGNALDQRLAGWRPVPPVPEVHLRSAFLQGLLLMPEPQAAQRLPAAAAALRRWHDACDRRGLDPLVACLCVVKAMPHVARCVVGVETPAHLDAIARAWAEARPMHAPELACDDAAVIDPRRWQLAA